MIFFKRLVWNFSPFAVLITLLSLAAVTWYCSFRLKELYFQRTETDLTARSRLIAAMVLPDVVQNRIPAIQSLVRSVDDTLSVRVTVIRSAGDVLADSREDPSRMDNHQDRPEFREALVGRIGTTVRFSNTLGRDMMYVAVPLRRDRAIIGAVRTSLPVTSLSEILSALSHPLALFSVGVGLILVLVHFARNIRLIRSISEIRKGVEAFGSGNLEHRIYPSGPDMCRSLAESLNQSAARIDDHWKQLLSRHDQIVEVLSTMSEGVIVVNAREEILRINEAAVRWFTVEQTRVLGRFVQEAIRNNRLLRIVRETLTKEKPVEEEVEILGEENRFLMAHGSVLRNPEGEVSGAVVVLSDITQLKKLETIRRDFVANVSHELKTPITAIKGSVETLKEGAIRKPGEAKRFLDMIGKNTDRLHTITEDLLSLSRIEQGSEKGDILFTPMPVKTALDEAAASCAAGAKAKKIRIRVECPEDLVLPLNAPMFEEAIVNLVDNAIKYSDPGSEVIVSGKSEGKTAFIRVKDSGCGIPRSHLPRLFERFYRVDTARSRDVGGSGLGLSIVKHIVQAHGGMVSVESIEGEGSTFTISIPMR
jgi:two-component system phosphate regulon sensor histidine kinase PhoR